MDAKVTKNYGRCKFKGKIKEERDKTTSKQNLFEQIRVCACCKKTQYQFIIIVFCHEFK